MTHPAIKIFHFNPTCEIATANASPYYQAPALLREFEEELAPLMLFFAGPKDHVLKDKTITNEFTDRISRCGFLMPEIIQRTNSLGLLKLTDEVVKLNPWGWSPAEKNYLSAYKQSDRSCLKAENMLRQSLFERKHAVDLVHLLVSDYPDRIFPKKGQLPILVDSVLTIESYLERHRQIVLKLPLSSSGRGLQVIRKNKLNESNKRWVKTGLKQQKYLIAEPLFDKRQDLSFQFEFKHSGEIEYLGHGYFNTNSNGQYVGQYLNYPLEEKEKYFRESILDDIASLLLRQMKKTIFPKYYHGFLGIDALIYEENRQIKIQPCLEINPRHNMGILGKYIEKKIHPKSTGIFQIFYHPAICYRDFAGKETKRTPPVMEDRKLTKGFVSLTDPHAASRFGAYLRLF